MKATVYREMYLANQIVEYHGRHGRVIYHDRLSHTVHVLFRVNTYTWKIEKCDEFLCRLTQMFLWGIESAFSIRHRMRIRTPQLAPMNADTDYFMEL